MYTAAYTHTPDRKYTAVQYEHTAVGPLRQSVIMLTSLLCDTSPWTWRVWTELLSECRYVRNLPNSNARGVCLAAYGPNLGILGAQICASRCSTLCGHELKAQAQAQAQAKASAP